MAARAMRSASGSIDSSDSSEGSPSTLGGAASLPSWQLSHPAVAARATAELYARRCFVDAMQKRTMPRSSTDADSRCLLLALSHDELDVIVDGLADPLQPTVAVAFSSTCKGLRTPLGPALEVLQERHARAVALCRNLEASCVELRDAEEMYWTNQGLTADDLATLAMILRTNGLPRMLRLVLIDNDYGDASVQALCEGLGCGAAPSLHLNLSNNQFGPADAEALAAALHRGAMRKLERLVLCFNPFGNQGVAALAAPLRKLPALKTLNLTTCEIGNEGVASLVANLGRDDFKTLEELYLDTNKITEAGCATLVHALDAVGTFPALHTVSLSSTRTSWAARQAVRDALARAITRR